VCGSSELIASVKATRTIFGTMADLAQAMNELA